MSTSREIRDKIKRIKNTGQLTKAMEMVSIAKMKRFQDKLRSVRPYAYKVRQMISDCVNTIQDLDTIHFVTKEKIKKVCFIIVSSNKGLCGGLNISLFRLILKQIETLRSQNSQVVLSIFGQKGLQFWKNTDIDLLSISQISDNPDPQEVMGATKIILDNFTAGDIDAVYICYNKWINTLKQQPVIEQFLPLAPIASSIEGDSNEYQSIDHLYEPSRQVLLNEMLKRYLEAVLYQSVIENMASEHSARMVAMKAAVDNASNFIKDLQLQYNKVRQAKVTAELFEIIGGAAAV